MPSPPPLTARRPLLHRTQAAPADDGHPASRATRAHWSYLPRQYGGLALGLAAVVGTAATYDPADAPEALVWKMVGWLLLCLVGLAAPEARPGKRQWVSPGGAIYSS